MKEEKVKKTSTKGTKKTAEKKETKKDETKEVKAAKKSTTKVTKVVKEKEIKEKALLNKKDQKAANTISHILGIFTKIARVLLMVAVPFMFLLMIIAPFVLSKVEVDGNVVKVDDIHLISKGDKYLVKFSDSTYLAKGNDGDMAGLYYFIRDNSRTYVIVTVEILVALVATIMIVNIYLLSNLEKLFYNIYNKKTPFIEENCEYLHKVCKIMIINVVLVFVTGLMVGLLAPGVDLSDVDTISLSSILIAYLLYYIFKYATEMQKESNTVFYG